MLLAADQLKRSPCDAATKLAFRKAAVTLIAPMRETRNKPIETAMIDGREVDVGSFLNRTAWDTIKRAGSDRVLGAADMIGRFEPDSARLLGEHRRTYRALRPPTRPSGTTALIVHRGGRRRLWLAAGTARAHRDCNGHLVFGVGEPTSGAQISCDRNLVDHLRKSATSRRTELIGSREAIGRFEKGNGFGLVAGELRGGR